VPSLLLFLLLLSAAPEHPHSACGDGALLARAESALRTRDHLSALLAYQEAVHELPGCGRAWVGLAEAWLRAGSHHRAWEFLDRAERDPASAAGASLARGVLLRRTMRVAEADVALARATRRDPALAAAWIQRAARSVEDLHLGRAWEEIEHALQLDPEDPRVYAVLETWLETGGRALSLTALLEERRLAGDRAALAGLSDLFYRLGLKRTREGKPLLAVAYYEQALVGMEALGDREAQIPVLLSLGWVTHTGRRDAEAALAHFDRALELARELGDREAEGRAWFNRGLVHAAEARRHLAEIDFRQSLAAASGADSLLLRKKAYKEIGDLRMAEGDLEGAADAYRSSLEIGLDRGSLQAGADTLLALSDLDRRIETYLSIVPPGLGPEAEAAGRLEARRDELRDLASREYRRHAEALVGGPEATEHRSEHFVVRSDYPAPQGVAAVAELLENVSEVYAELFGDAFPEAGPQPTTTVYLLSSREDYDRLTALFMNSASSRGHFVPEHQIMVLRLEREVRATLMASATHESVHVLNHHYLAPPDGDLPPWLDEGLAMYLALTRIDAQGRFRFGKVEEGRAWVDGTSLEREGETWLKGLRQSLTGEGVVPLAEVVGQADRSRFLGPDRHLYYSESWTLVHFLLHGDGEAWREGFHAYLRGVREGRGSIEDLERALDTDLPSLQRAWRNYVIYRL
jgi:tetratricopeptide (TPR) repeat protein